MAVTNFDTFCVSPDYVMSNTWKDSRHITDDFSCYLYPCHKIFLCFDFNDTLGNRLNGRGGPITWPLRSPDLTPLDFHFYRYMKTLVYETPMEAQQDLVVSTSSSSSHPWCAGGNISKNSAWHDQAIYKMYRSDDGHIEHLLKWIKWCLLTVFQLSALLLS